MEPGSCQQCSVQDRRQQAQGDPSEHLAALLCCAVIEHWHRLPIGCGVPSLETFRSHLDMGTMLWVFLLEQRMDLMNPEVSSNPDHSVIL